MPYEWSKKDMRTGSGARLHMWPYRSLPKRGFVTFIAITAAMLAIPLLALIGQVALWGLLPFLLLAVIAIWLALGRSYKDGELLETLTLRGDDISVHRREPYKADQEWRANPYWVQVALQTHGGPVDDYLTLKGSGRTIEIGAFLTPEERVALHKELSGMLAELKQRTG